MPSYKLVFLVQHGRELKPQLSLHGVTLAKVEVSSAVARAELAEHLRPIAPRTLEVDGYIPAVIVQIEAEDESQALLAGFHQAALSLAPYSLIVPEQEMIDFSRERPTVLPHALLIDEVEDPPTVAFRYQAGPGLLRLNVGKESIARVRSFNNDVVRRIAELYPHSILGAGAERTSLELRIARAVHWYSQAEGQSDPTMAFVCYWIGLEALVLKSSASSRKKQSLVKRLTSRPQPGQVPLLCGSPLRRRTA